MSFFWYFVNAWVILQIAKLMPKRTEGSISDEIYAPREQIFQVSAIGECYV